jgi:putative DNA primase/helicase
VWKVPYLRGLILAPMVRFDGSILETPGYDSKTALFYDPGHWDFPTVPAAPTLDDARQALAYLKHPLRSLPFADPPSESVALSGILTALNRKALPTAPLHAFSSPVAGSGKSLLVDGIAMISTGSRTAVITNSASGNGEQALEANLQSSMLRGDAILSIDNQSTALQSDMLCSLLSQMDFSIRLFHTQTSVVVPLVTSFFCTGNNLTIKGDLTRRALVSNIDAHSDRPELRSFDFDFLHEIGQARGKLVTAALTLIRWRHLSGEQQQAGALGGYERWCYVVRDTLLLLGEPDPLEVIEAIRGKDPVLLKLRVMLSAWTEVFGETPVKCSDVISTAMKHTPSYQGEEDEIWLHPNLREALSALAPGGRVERMTATTLGYWLRGVSGRPVDGRRFTATEDRNGINFWSASLA